MKKKNVLLVGVLLVCGLSFVSCDQDESVNDNWSGKEYKSLSSNTRSASSENNEEDSKVKLLYIKAGAKSETRFFGKNNQVILQVTYSWNGGFTFDTNDLNVSASASTSEPNCICSLDWSVTNKMLTTSYASFMAKGTIVCKDTVNKVSNSYNIYEAFTGEVECEERNPME